MQLVVGDTAAEVAVGEEQPTRGVANIHGFLFSLLVGFE
jgi:hypothetical protein